jgi:hypothetical protein
VRRSIRRVSERVSQTYRMLRLGRKTAIRICLPSLKISKIRVTDDAWIILAVDRFSAVLFL